MWKVKLSDVMCMYTDLYIYFYSFVYIYVFSVKLTLSACVWR